jgi:hypothetical protein
LRCSQELGYREQVEVSTLSPTPLPEEHFNIIPHLQVIRLFGGFAVTFPRSPAVDLDLTILMTFGDQCNS